MPRLIHPEAGTVVACGDDLADNYRARGWVDADADTHREEAATEKPQPVKRRTKTTS